LRRHDERQLNAFAEASLENSFKLAIARDLERPYSPLVTEPIPPNLRSYIDPLERLSTGADPSNEGDNRYGPGFSAFRGGQLGHGRRSGVRGAM
jgi:hypothetical protein